MTSSSLTRSCFLSEGYARQKTVLLWKDHDSFSWSWTLTFQKNFICFNNSPLNMMKNAFYFILKALFVLKIFQLLSWLSGNIKKISLIRKANFENYDVTAWNITREIWNWNVTREIMEWLMEYNKRNIFLQKLSKKWGWETGSKPLVFLKASL